MILKPRSKTHIPCIKRFLMLNLSSTNRDDISSFLRKLINFTLICTRLYMHRYFINTLLILQQQHYKPQAFLYIYKSRFLKLRSYSSRQQIDRTTKLIALLCSTLLIYICISIFVAVITPIYITTAYMNYAYIIYIIIFFATFPLHFPLLISLIIVLFTPFQYIISQILYKKTKKLLTTRHDLIIVSIA